MKAEDTTAELHQQYIAQLMPGLRKVGYNSFKDFLRQSMLEVCLTKSYFDSPPVPCKRRMKIKKLQPNDILMGRGTHLNVHPGNWMFRQVVALNKPEYNAMSRSDKSMASAVLKLHLEHAGCRFLEPIFKKSTKSTKGYVLAERARIVEKLSQGMREKNPSLNGFVPMVRKRVKIAMERIATSQVGQSTPRATLGKRGRPAKTSEPKEGTQKSIRTGSDRPGTPKRTKLKKQTKEGAKSVTTNKKTRDSNNLKTNTAVAAIDKPVQAARGCPSMSTTTIQPSEPDTPDLSTTTPPSRSKVATAATTNDRTLTPSILDEGHKLAQEVDPSEKTAKPPGRKTTVKRKTTATRRFTQVYDSPRNVGTSELAATVSLSSSEDASIPQNAGHNKGYSPLRPVTLQSVWDTELQSETGIRNFFLVEEEILAFAASYRACAFYAHSQILRQEEYTAEAFSNDTDAINLCETLRPSKLRKIGAADRILPLPTFYSSVS
jgi:hypothetical protein